MSDWMDFRPIATDPEVMRYINGGVPWSDEQIQSFVKRQVELYEGQGYCRWRLSLKGSSEIIGFCGVGLWQDAPEIGWWLARRYWGMGLASEAARKALQDVFERTQLDQIISVAQAENAASIRIMEKLGLTKETEFVNDDVRRFRYVITRRAYFAMI